MKAVFGAITGVFFGYKKNKFCFSADWTVSRLRRPAISSAD